LGSASHLSGFGARRKFRRCPVAQPPKPPRVRGALEARGRADANILLISLSKALASVRRDLRLTWFDFDESRRHEREHQLFGFLTTEANDVVGAIHPKAMPVILRTPAEIETWITAPAEEALKLQRPLTRS
jgi:hypothetical protein